MIIFIHWFLFGKNSEKYIESHPPVNVSQWDQVISLILFCAMKIEKLGKEIDVGKYEVFFGGISDVYIPISRN